MTTIRTAISLALGMLLVPLVGHARQLEDGDIVFQRSVSRQAHAIAAATGSRFTHVGVVFFDQGEAYVYEEVQPVRRTKLKVWAQRGKSGDYVVRRLKDRSKVDLKKLKAEVVGFLGRDYDYLFGWSDKKIYCSELVWKAYHRSCGIKIGELKRLGDFNLEHKNVRPLVVRRYRDKVPRDMKVISPSDMYESELLVTVVAKPKKK